MVVAGWQMPPPGVSFLLPFDRCRAIPFHSISCAHIIVKTEHRSRENDETIQVQCGPIGVASVASGERLTREVEKPPQRYESGSAGRTRAGEKKKEEQREKVNLDPYLPNGFRISVSR